jgi:hypothetical protein
MFNREVESKHWIPSRKHLDAIVMSTSHSEVAVSLPTKYGLVTFSQVGLLDFTDEYVDIPCIDNKVGVLYKNGYSLRITFIPETTDGYKFREGKYQLTIKSVNDYKASAKSIEDREEYEIALPAKYVKNGLITGFPELDEYLSDCRDSDKDEERHRFLDFLKMLKRLTGGRIEEFYRLFSIKQNRYKSVMLLSGKKFAKISGDVVNFYIYPNKKRATRYIYEMELYDDSQIDALLEVIKIYENKYRFAVPFTKSKFSMALEFLNEDERKELEQISLLG